MFFIRAAVVCECVWGAAFHLSGNVACDQPCMRMAICASSGYMSAPSSLPRGGGQEACEASRTSSCGLHLCTQGNHLCVTLRVWQQMCLDAWALVGFLRMHARLSTGCSDLRPIWSALPPLSPCSKRIHKQQWIHRRMAIRSHESAFA